MLSQGGQLSGEQVFTDVYWDAEGCGLTERDWWLRSRAGRWELKASMEIVRVRVWCCGAWRPVFHELRATLPSWAISAEDFARFFGSHLFDSFLGSTCISTSDTVPGSR